jgi:type II secretory pathway pseudopilin PulG
MLFRRNTKAFTLVEILLWILIVSVVMVSAFQALSSIGIWKIRLIQKTQTQKQALYFSEKLFEMIKYGGTIDFEEYFNRKVVNTNNPATVIYWSWHYIRPTGFGNFWITGVVGTSNYKMPPIPPVEAEFYYCQSPNGGPLIWSDWCYSSHISTWNPQTYGQYSFQFIDYNSDSDASWDEDGDWDFRWDDDDEFLWEWPEVFAIWTDVKELYLINWVKRERTYFRYNVWLDPYAPNGSTCTSSNSGATYTWTGCLWTIEYLKLEWRDWWLDHNSWSWDTTQNDGVIDTWVISPEFTWGAEIIAWSNTVDYWQPLFPENINVTEFKVFPHPNIDTDRAWKLADIDKNVAEYVRLQLSMKAGWKDRRKLQWTPKEYKLSTTINLTDIFTR